MIDYAIIIFYLLQLHACCNLHTGTLDVISVALERTLFILLQYPRIQLHSSSYSYFVTNECAHNKDIIITCFTL